jgi:transposase-like protein
MMMLPVTYGPSGSRGPHPESSGRNFQGAVDVIGLERERLAVGHEVPRRRRLVLWLRDLLPFLRGFGNNILDPGMKQHTSTPATLIDAVRFFAKPDICLTFLASLRWPDGNVICPKCGGQDVTFLSEYRRWKCHQNHPQRQFSIKVGTIFEDSPIGLDKWLPAVWMLVNDKNGISSYEAARALGVTQKTAWFMLHRIRLAMQDGSVERLRGRVETDETYIGGKVRNMHKARRDRVDAGSARRLLQQGHRHGDAGTRRAGAREGH